MTSVVFCSTRILNRYIFPKKFIVIKSVGSLWQRRDWPTHIFSVVYAHPFLACVITSDICLIGERHGF